MKRMALGLMFLSCSAMAEDPGLTQLRQSFSTLIQSSTAQFDKAASMKPAVIGLGAEISKDVCDALAAKIKPNYKIDPFQFIFEGGSSNNSMCGGRWGWEKNNLQNLSGKTNQGLPYSIVIQLQGRDDMGYEGEISNYFIDSSYRIVEIQGLSINKQTQELFGYGITSLDSVGNLYVSVFVKDYSLSGGLAHDVSGTRTMEQFIPADGSAPFPLLRNSVKNSADSSKDYQIVSWDRSDQKDWADFQLPITLSDSGGYYAYGGKYYSTYDRPNFKSSLTVKYRGGKEYCAYGYTKADKNWAEFPADQTTRENCSNY